MMRWLVIVLMAIAIAIVPLRGDTASVKKRHRTERSTARPEYNIRHHKPVDDAAPSVPFDRSIVNESRVQNYGARASALPPPPPSPGIAIGITAYDQQSNQSQGYQVARIPGADIVHFVWTYEDIIPIGDCSLGDCRSVAYSSYRVSTSSLNHGFGGVYLSNYDERGGYTNIAADDSNRAHVYLHKRQLTTAPYHSWHYSFPDPDSAAFDLPTELGGTEPLCSEVLWPHGAVARDAGSNGSPIHVLAHDGNNCSRDIIWYWRYDGSTWTGPAIIDSSFTLGYVVTDDPNSDNVAIALHTDREPTLNGFNNVAYYESNAAGLDWINGTGLGDANKNIITNYNSPDGPQAWYHISTAYDNSGTLHIVWDEQQLANISADVAIKHWNSSRQTMRTVAVAYWPNPLSSGKFSLNLSKVTLGVGDGSTPCQGGATSNDDYLYVLYTRFAGPTQAEQDDHSLEGMYNGELYLNVSADGGLTWSPPQNLTNTKTPLCNPGPGAPGAGGAPPRPDSVCRSEHWATIGQAVTDIDILFISDLDAGSITGGEGNWQQNPVHYLRLPGGTTNAPYVCPILAPQMAAFMADDPNCEYHALPMFVEDDFDLTIGNIGNGSLDAEVTVLPGAPWLSVTGAGPLTIVPAGGDVVLGVVMDATTLSEGLYSGTIRVTHNDSSQPNPLDFPINFFVADQFFCPEDEHLATAMSPGVLSLEVQSGGRYAAQNPEGGLWRHRDSSSSIYDASIVIAHGAQSPDTIVFHDFYDGTTDPGHNGFVPTAPWVINTDAYGTGQGYAYGSFKMATKDSAVGVDVVWIYPQHPDSAEFILADYKVYNRTAAPLDLVIGQWIDFDVLPAGWLGGVQFQNDNQSAHDWDWNLIYQYGQDTTNHPPAGQRTAERYSGGISYVAGVDRIPSHARSVRAHIRDNADYTEADGPASGFMYSMLSGPLGYNLYSPPPDSADLYTILTLDQGRTLNVGDTLHYVIALVSDTLSNPQTASPSDSTSLMKTVRKAWLWAQANGLVCRCDCHTDPICDGATNVLDVVSIIDRAFRAAATIGDPSCFAYGSSVDGRTDVNCSGMTDILDVVLAIDVTFRNGDPDVKFCKLCAI